MVYDKEDLDNIIKRCITKADLCRELGIKPVGGNYRKIDKIIEDYDIDFSHYQGIHWKKGKHVVGYKIANINELLVEFSKYKNTNSLKKRLLREGIKQNVCEKCGCDGTKEGIVIELHHINGDSTDNRLENLQMLCPNCHSKTDNFRFKGGRVHLSRQEYTLTDEEYLEKKAEKNGKKQKDKKTILMLPQICENCGKEFHSRRKQRYCSVDCYRQSNSKNRPTFLALIQDFKELKNFTRVGLKYNVCDKAVVKWCKLYGIPCHIKELKEFIDNF